jgi:hypothetical protein
LNEGEEEQEQTEDDVVAGTHYLYDTTRVTSLHDVNSFDIIANVGDGIALLWAQIDGKCTRDASLTTGHCNFAYTIRTVPESEGGESFIVGSFVAEGTMEGQFEFGTLTVKGGTNIFWGVEGQIMIQAVTLDRSLDPPFPDSLTCCDVLDDADGYAHFITISADPEFFVL